MAQKLAGAEVGMVLGWMSTRVLGQYDLLIIEEESPLDQDLVYYVGPNVLALEKQFAFPPREFRLWLALHEVTHRAQFTGIAWMRPHFLGLVSDTLDSVDPDPKRFVEVAGRLAESLRRGENPLAEGGIMALLASAEQRQVLDQVSGLMSLLEGHGDITMDRAGRGLVPSADRFSRVLHQRRESTQGVARLLQQLIGLEAKMNQYAQGERFIEAVERVGGPRAAERGLGEPRPPAHASTRSAPRDVDRPGRAGPGRLSGPAEPAGSIAAGPRRSRPDWSTPQASARPLPLPARRHRGDLRGVGWGRLAGPAGAGRGRRAARSPPCTSITGCAPARPARPQSWPTPPRPLGAGFRAERVRRRSTAPTSRPGPAPPATGALGPTTRCSGHTADDQAETVRVEPDARGRA